MSAVNPEILVRAHGTAGLTLQNAAARVGIRGVRGVAAVHRLAPATESPGNVPEQRPRRAPRALDFTTGWRR